MGKPKCQESDEITAPGWMTTYGDLMSLLLVFFILVLSFSSTERVKFRKAIGSLKGGNGFLEPNSGNTPFKVEDYVNESDDFQQQVRELSRMLEEQGMTNQVDFYQDSKGIRFVLKTPILFPEAQAVLRSEVLPILDQIALIISKFPHENVVIEGHTDDTPIHTKLYPSNWELSTARALAVLKYYAGKHLVKPDHLVACGYGEYRPVVPNSSPANKAKNRRVEIFIEKRDLDSQLTQAPLTPDDTGK